MAVSRMAVNDVSIWCAKRWPASAETIEIDSACSVGKRERQLDFIDAGGPNGEKLRGKILPQTGRTRRLLNPSRTDCGITALRSGTHGPGTTGEKSRNMPVACFLPAIISKPKIGAGSFKRGRITTCATAKTSRISSHSTWARLKLGAVKTRFTHTNLGPCGGLAGTGSSTLPGWAPIDTAKSSAFRRIRSMIVTAGSFC